jgi:hypothetical protein
MLSLHERRLLLILTPFARGLEAFEGLRPVFFGPCTLRRTWGTRPVKRAAMVAQGSSAYLFIADRGAA